MKTHHSNPGHLRDFTTDVRVLIVAAIAVVVATAGLFAGIVLLKLIRLATNVAYFGQFSLAELKLQDTPLGLAAIFVPVIGALIIGLMARYGSEKIRGHGIPEAIEA
ncbi:chloride channel protein, partial [Mesorhizobium sp. ES1-4]|nr:chloride channel protein [Mesorhizobium sp. ES1-4]